MKGRIILSLLLIAVFFASGGINRSESPKAQVLIIGLDSSTPISRNVVPGEKKAVFVRFKIANTYDRDVAIESLAISQMATAEPDDFDSIDFYYGDIYLNDYDQRGSFGGVGSGHNFASISAGSVSEGKALFIVPARSSGTITVAADISANAKAGRVAVFSMLQDHYIYTTDRLPMTSLSFTSPFPLSGNAMFISER